MEIFYIQCLNCVANIEFDRPQDFLCPSCGWVNSDKRPEFNPILEDYNEDLSKIVYVPIDSNKLNDLDLGTYRSVLKVLDGEQLNEFEEEQIKSKLEISEINSYNLIIQLLDRYMKGKNQYFKPNLIDIYENISWKEYKNYIKDKEIPKKFDDEQKFIRSIEILKDKFNSYYKPISKFSNELMNIFKEIIEPPEELKPYTTVISNLVARIISDTIHIGEIDKKLKPVNELIKFIERISNKIENADAEFLMLNWKQIRKLVRRFKKEFSSTFGNALR